MNYKSMVACAVKASLVGVLVQGSLALAAEDDAGQLDEIVVTANYRGEALQSVGSSIGVIGAADLEKRNITEFIDISRNVPGLNVIDTGPGQKTIFIRGLVGAGESTVGLYYDGMPTTGSGESAAAAAGRQTDLYVYDAERVEVLRGPQSTLYGSSALAGVVRVITKQPDLVRAEQEVVLGGSTTASGDSSYALKAMLNMPLIDDRLALRFVGYKAHDGGFIDNSYLGLKDVNSVDQLGMRSALKWALTDRDMLTAQFFAQNMDAADQAVERPFGITIGSTFVPAAGALTNDVHARQPRRDSTRMGSLNYTHYFDSFSLSLQQSVFRRKNHDAQDIANLPDFFSFIGAFDDIIPQGVFDSVQGTRMNTTEARLVTNSAGPWNGVAGLLYSDRKVDVFNSFFETDPVSGTVDPSIDPWYQRVADFKLKQAAAYGELSYNFNDRLKATGGLRAFRNERTDHAHSIIGFMRTSGETPVTTLTAKESKVIYKAALNYQFTDDIMGYVSASEGYRAGGTVNQVVPELPPSYGPDYTWNYELGMKSEWLNRRLQLNVAAYRIDWYDMQYSGDFFDGVFEGVLNCQGKCAHSNGLEVDITARPMPGLDLTLSSTVMKAELDRALPEANGAPVSGTQLANTPKFSFAASAGYSWGLTDALQASVHADIQYTGKVDIVNYRPAMNIPSPAYALFNLSASLAGNDRWEARLYGRNLGNKRAQINTINDSVTPAWVYVNRPRTIGLEMTFRAD